METTPDAPYTEIELMSYLPNGWRLGDDGALAWEARKRRWRGAVFDPADQRWEFTIPDAEACSGERLEALAAAYDRLYREALG